MMTFIKKGCKTAIFCVNSKIYFFVNSKIYFCVNSKIYTKLKFDLEYFLFFSISVSTIKPKFT